MRVADPAPGSLLCLYNGSWQGCASFRAKRGQGQAAESVLAVPHAVVRVTCTVQAEAEKQLEEQQEKQARALKALGRAQKLLATHVSMAQQQRPGSSSSTGQQQRPGSSASSGTSSGSSSHRDARAGGSSDGAAAAAAAGPVSVADAEELEADVQLSQLRLVMKGMLQELRALDTHNPGDDGQLQRLILVWSPHPLVLELQSGACILGATDLQLANCHYHGTHCLH